MEAGLKQETAILYNNLAATYIQRGRPVAALHYCEQAIKVLPQSHLHRSNSSSEKSPCVWPLVESGMCFSDLQCIPDRRHQHCLL